MPIMSNSLRFGELRDANVRRLPEFKNPKGEVAHAKADGSDWTPLEWGGATGGEMGELLNLLKKLRRGDAALDDTIECEETKAWLIERLHPNGPSDFWVGDGWASVTRDAVQYKTRAQAERTLSHLRLMGVQGTIEALEHLWVGPAVTLRQAKECADIVCYLDHTANQVGVDLGEAVRAKFNEVSDRVGSKVKL